MRACEPRPYRSLGRDAGTACHWTAARAETSIGAVQGLQANSATSHWIAHSVPDAGRS